MQPKLLLLAIFVAFIVYSLATQAQTNLPPLPSYLMRDYDETGRQLPPGVPREVDTNGKVIYIPMRFTTPAYRDAAVKLVLHEANEVAKDLRLPEQLPITESNIVEYHIGTFGFNYAHRSVGFVTTKNYSYYVSKGDKFSDLVVANYDQTCLKLKSQSLPIAQLNTNAAYQLATQWLSAALMDVKGLNRDCKVHTAVSPFWNGLVNLGDRPRSQFVPIYYVWWTSPEDEANGGSTANVEFFSPTKKLLQLTVSDPKYILRKPLVFTNLADLFLGVAPIHTNHPVKTIYMPSPPPE